MRFATIEAFAAARRTDQADMEKDLFPDVTTAMDRYPATGWYNDLLAEVARLYVDTYHREGGQGTPKQTQRFLREVRDTLDKTTNPDDNTVDRVSTWLATAILNAATMEATATDEEFLVMEWVTMHDEDVRDAHAATEGQQRPPNEPYDVDGTPMRYPGDPTAPIELWINCRCSLAPTVPDRFTAGKPEVRSPAHFAATTQEVEMDPTTMTPWHGVLAPEGVWSGDKRSFAPGALRFRDLPLPLTWQKASSNGHDGSVTVAKIERIVRVENEMRASGTFLSTPEADEAVGLVAEFGRFGVSVDADDAEFEFDDETDQVTFTSARIASASMLPIPAFAEAWLALGPPAPGFLPDDAEVPKEADGTEKADDECDPQAPDYEDCLRKKAEAEEAASNDLFVAAVAEAFAEDAEFKDYDAKQRKDAHTVPGTDSYPIEDCQDLRNAIQAIGRAKDPAATKRHIKTQKERLGCPDVSIPDDWAVETDEFDRGAGWITDPVATKRIHDYWTKKGQPGYAKINWGVPGDFNRCRVLVGEKIAKNSPEDMVFLNQICARWHHDALGWWPGRPTSGDVEAFVQTNIDLGLPVYELSTTPGPALSLVASTSTPKAPAEWFGNPHFTAPHPMTVTDDGRVFGHLAEWQTCHTAYSGVCVAPPRSASGYAYFLTGQVFTDAGPVAVGQITMSLDETTGGHARPSRMRPALAHYDNTCTVVADVNCGEDDHGIWVAGMVRPGTTDEKVYALRASVLSGDWRQLGDDPDDLEMIAALAVNTGGFPIPRVGIENGVQVSLVAAGVVQSRPSGEGPDLEAMVERVLQARDERRLRMQQLRERVAGGV